MPLDKVPYEMALRSIGAYFDEHGAQEINVIETNEGFSIRYQPDPVQPDLRSGEFKYDDLESLTGHLEWHRNPRHSARNGDQNGRYQDFFRALGHELDYVTAYDILLDEVGDSILLTYLQLDPAHSVAARKLMIMVGSKERQEVLASAHRRRIAGSTQPGLLDVLAGRAKTEGQEDLETGTREARTGTRRADAPWEIGERELYATVLKGASTDGPDHGVCELVLTNRRIVLRFRDGSLHRTRIADATDVSPDVRREILTKHYRIEVSLSGGTSLGMDCQSAEHMSEVLKGIETARSDSSS